MKKTILDFLRLIRAPLLIGMPLPVLYGAISVQNLTILNIIPLLIIGILSGIYSFVLNDYIDIDIDRLRSELSKRPLVSGTISKKTAKIVILSCFIGAYLVIFLFFFRFEINFFTALAVLIIADILGAIYNIYGKKITGSDLIVALSQSLFLLFGALIVSSKISIGFITWILFSLTFLQLFYMNAIAAALKDVDHDYIKKIRNLAFIFGVKVANNKKFIVPTAFKILGTGIRCTSIFVIFLPFFYYNVKYQIIQIALLLILSIITMYCNFKILFLKKFDKSKLKKMIMIQLALHYIIVPIILISFTNLVIILLITFVPIIWYFLVSYTINEKSLDPQML